MNALTASPQVVEQERPMNRVTVNEFVRLIDETAADLRSLSDVLECRRILRERDDDMAYLLNYRDDTGRSPGALQCGCEPGKDCAWHQHCIEIAEEQS